MVDFNEFDIVHLGVSGGKDSTAALLWLVYESGAPHEKLDVTFCDTGNEHAWTYGQIAMLSERVFPITTIKPPLDFYELAKKKGRFPGAKSRFCTQELKIYPSQKHCLLLQNDGRKVLLLSGVRANESKARSELEEYEWDGFYAAWMYRPLLRWSVEDVWAIHQKYDIPRNPLYDIGCKRVGCLPCIMSNKHEIRIIAKMFPERIDMIRQAEKEVGEGSTFFKIGTVPDRFASVPVTTKDGRELFVPSIDDVVDWSKTGNHRPDQYEMDFNEGLSCPSNAGLCE
jgi:3'-phosphoadenosine 5'-phosphosulfate sulfotransferase (PAPS reductase)/FAD synthetase